MVPNSTTSLPPLEDYRWLVSDAALPYLERSAEAGETSTRLVKSLRQELTAAKTHLVLQQSELRRRARVKFQLADQMFFTPQTLEQATGEPIARYKASRFPQDTQIADLCCGIGGDLLSLGQNNEATGFDRDPVVALFAEANCRAHNLDRAQTKTTDASDVKIENFTHWHIDPDRRSGNKRFSNPTFCEPNVDAIDELLSRNKNAAIKLAPAANVPEHWSESVEREWIGHNRECKQQIAWCGDLARSSASVSATIIGRDAADTKTIVGQPNIEVAISNSIGRYIFEPHAAILAAKLDGHVANQHNLERVATKCAYFTTNHSRDVPGFTAFQVHESIPYDFKKLKAHLRQNSVGVVEVKSQGTRIDPDKLQTTLKGRGAIAETIFLLKIGDNTHAALASRA